MANRAQQIRQAALNAWPQAEVVERGLNHLRHSLGTGRFALDCAPALHLPDNREIDTALLDSDLAGYADMPALTPYLLHSGTDGARRIYPRRDRLDQYIEFGAPEYWSGSSWQALKLPARTKVDNRISWDTPNFGIHLTATATQSKLEIVLKKINAARRLRWPVSLAGLTFDNWQLFDGATPIADITRPSVVRDGNGLLIPERIVGVSYVDGYIEFSVDITGLTFPITIDPTIDVQVGATADDGWAYDGTVSLYTTLTYFASGNVSGVANAFTRFTGISGLAGQTIDVSYCQYYTAGKAGTTWLTKLMADDQQAAAAPTTYAAYNAITPTTAQVDWDPATWPDVTWNQSPSLNTVIQELVDSYGDNLTVIQLLWKDDGCALSNYISGNDYTNNTELAAKLHIEYSAGGTAYLKTVSEGAQVAETSQRNMVFRRAWPEVIQASETLQSAGVFVRLKAETINLLEQAAPYLSLRRLFAETINAAEATMPRGGFLRLVAEGINIASRPWAGLALSRYKAESINVTDQQAKTMTLVRLISEVMSLIETSRATMTLRRYWADLLTVGENASNALASQILKFIAELAQVTEARDRFLAITRALAETVQLQGVLQKAGTFARSIAETITLAEATLRGLTLRRAIAETIQILEATGKALSLNRLIAELTQIGEAIGTAAAFVRSQADTVQIGEAISSAGAFVRHIAETLRVNEAINTALATPATFIKYIIETVQLSDTAFPSMWPAGRRLLVTFSSRAYNVAKRGRTYVAQVVRPLKRAKPE